MKVIDGYCDYCWERELESLMVKMANLSTYQPILFDSIILSEDKRKLFNKRQEDYYLFEASLLYIFSEPVYRERISTAFKGLTRKERSNFYAYYKSFGETAVKNGFLAEYTQILQKITPVWIGRYIDIISFGCFLFYAYNVTNSFFVTISLYIILSLLWSINDSLDKVKTSTISTTQADLLIKKLNSDLIDANLEWSKKKLIEFGWLNKDAEILLAD